MEGKVLSSTRPLERGFLAFAIQKLTLCSVVDHAELPRRNMILMVRSC